MNTTKKYHSIEKSITLSQYSIYAKVMINIIMENFYSQGKKKYSCAHTSYFTFIEQKRGLLKKGRHCGDKSDSGF